MRVVVGAYIWDEVVFFFILVAVELFSSLPELLSTFFIGFIYLRNRLVLIILVVVGLWLMDYHPSVILLG